MGLQWIQLGFYKYLKGLNLKSQTKSSATILLIALSLASLGFITYVDNFAAHALTLFSPSLVPIAYARFSSFFLALIILLFVDRSAFLFDQKKINWVPLNRAALFWLVPAAVGVLWFKIWVPKIQGWIDVTAFMFTGLFAEEFLFRGALYALAAKVFAAKNLVRIPVAVLYSSVFFSVQHLQYHSFDLNAPAVTQMTYTFVMGIFFGLVRHHGGSIWPAIGIHVVNNSFTILRNMT